MPCDVTVYIAGGRRQVDTAGVSQRAALRRYDDLTREDVRGDPVVVVVDAVDGHRVRVSE